MAKSWIVLLFSAIFWQKDCCIGLFVRWEQRPTCSRGHDHIPDPNDCHGFYHCWGYRLTHKYCGPFLMFNPVTKVCDWPTVVSSIRPSCSGSKQSNIKKVFSKPTTILSNNKPKRKVVQHSTTKFPSSSTTRRTTTSTTTTTRRTTSRTTTSTTTTTTTTTTSRSTSTTSSSLPTIVKGSNLISQSSTTATTTKVPNRSFPKNSKITFIKPVIIHSPAFHNPIHHGFGIKPKPKRKVKKKPMNFGSSSKPNRIKSGHNNNTKKDSVKNIYGYNSFFDISSLKVFTRSNTTSLMP